MRILYKEQQWFLKAVFKFRTSSIINQCNGKNDDT